MSKKTTEVTTQLKDIRTAMALSQTHLAHLAGIAPNTLCEIENGVKLPSLPTALRLARALGCGVSELFSLTD